MKKDTFIDAFSAVYDSYLEDLSEVRNRRHFKPGTIRWIAVVAAACVVAGVGLLLINNNYNSVFSITVYAMGPANTISVNKLSRSGDSASISRFNAGTGDSVYVFSYDDETNDTPPKVVYFPTASASENIAEHYNEIRQMAAIDYNYGEVYVVYIVGEKDSAPYMLTVSDNGITSPENMETVVHIEISEENGDCFACITGSEVRELSPDHVLIEAEQETDNPADVPENIDDLLRPYQDVIDRLNSDHKLQLFIPENRKLYVYNNIKNLTVEEFEAQMLENYKEITGEDGE